MATPVIKALPAAPTRSDGADDFAAKADTFVAALPPLVVQINSTSEWIGGQVAAVEGYKTAAAGSASAAADSAGAADAAKLAAQKAVTDAEQAGAAQVKLAQDQAVAAKQQADSAKASAEAAGAAAGLPVDRKPFDVLQIGPDNSIRWASTNQIGDVILSARNPGEQYLAADGAVYLNSAYPLLSQAVGKISNPPGNVWVTTAYSPQTSTNAGLGTDGKGVWMFGGSRSVDNGVTFTPVGGSLQGELSQCPAILSDGKGTWVAHIRGRISRSVDNGVTWTQVVTSVQTGASEGAQLATDGNGTWMAWAYSNYFAISKDNGLTWTSKSPPQGAQGACYIGDNTWITTNGYRSVDGGLTWSLYGASAGNPLAGGFMLYLGNNIVIAQTSSGLKRSMDGGFSWQSLGVGNSNNIGVGGITTDGKGTVYAVSGTDKLISNDYGVTWQLMQVPMAAGIIAGMIAYGMGKVIITNKKGTEAIGYSSSVETFDYDPNTQFKLPSLQKVDGVKYYIKAKEAA